MNQQQDSRIALAAIMPGRLPRALRVALVLSLVILSCGLGVMAYRHLTQPTTLTIAAGSVDGYVPRFMLAIAARMAATNAPVRLKVVEKANTNEAMKAFSAGEVDLAIARADALDLSVARSVLIVTHGVVLMIAVSGGSIDDIDGLKGKTVGVVGGDINRPVVAAITKEYDLDQAKVRFRDLELKDVAQAIQSKQVHAVLVVMPISPWYLGLLREVLPRTSKFKVGLIPIESADAIAAINKAYESYELPKGTVRGLPPVPDEDLTTLRVPIYLVAKKSLDKEVVESLAKAIMDARRDLSTDHPILAQISAPSSDKDELVQIHPGAAAFFEGETKTLFDKYGDQFFYGSLMFGSVMSVLAAIWKFMTKSNEQTTNRPPLRLYALMEDIRQTQQAADLVAVEAKIDGILQRELEKYASSDIDAGEMGALSLATHRLEYAIAQRRLALANAPAGVKSREGLPMKAALMTTLAAATLVAAVQTGPASAQSQMDRSVDQYSCKDVMRDSGAGREIAIAFLHGYLLGKAGKTQFNLDVLLKQTDAFIEQCLDNPNAKAMDTMINATK
jgi:TRAP transporter TAXI family solute receptor